MSARRVCVLGGGAWGSVFALICRDAGNDVTVWARRAEQVDEINAGTNRAYVGDVRLDGIRATTSLEDAVSGADLVAVAVPSGSVRECAAAFAPYLRMDASVLSLVKGVEAGTLSFMTDVLVDALGCSPQRVLAVSGPNLSAEIARHQPTGTVVAGSDAERAGYVASRIHTAYFRPYVGSDIIGAEVGGVVKNIVAMAVGACTGMKLGVNTRSFIINRGLTEMARLGVALGARSETFLGLAGLGDLVATCSSELSRNFSFGYRLGQGMNVSEALEASAGTVEGATSCPHVLALAGRLGVDMPIAQATQDVLDGHVDVETAALRVFRSPRVTDGVDARAV
ncbi:NAD(P)-dependent glycerol-3-phosphate dehydrogenase [Nanchangia anserum]|uniref:Glycerol-3-phosphate dehydrogenase [NAD(P)+] n=1 Tax=Nanchangia anserum TaxID=2692125 RepID=A0A8I0KPH4_9ACTO|nr:NAD(P)H-dependent glycerol-3-phosphate dehydrogenase [Nanchangia anserum]MBD3688895.1 NAD(P)-dependent glycerol-3-phosphate dehydrogenase [Nanchangia anserum]QOX81159.1 NAD(P)-dependent glycerol-3-phosphate dehydrogenase [Nanchangia anserum]